MVAVMHVVVSGPRGSGKTEVARQISVALAEANRPFRVIDGGQVVAVGRPGGPNEQEVVVTTTQEPVAIRDPWNPEQLTKVKDLGSKPSDFLFVPAALTLDEYQARTQDTAIYPGQGTPLGLAYVALKMNGEAGEFSEHLGKAIRDDGLVSKERTFVRDGEFEVGADVIALNALTPERRALLKKEIGDVLWYLAAGARELGYTLSEVARDNLDKLADRKARGALQGSGDLR
jgi:hypothetical protein